LAISLAAFWISNCSLVRLKSMITTPRMDHKIFGQVAERRLLFRLLKNVQMQGTRHSEE
jgi:hypothetical protein